MVTVVCFPALTQNVSWGEWGGVGLIGEGSGIRSCLKVSNSSWNSSEGGRITG